MKKYLLYISYILLFILSLSCDPFDSDSYFPLAKKTTPVTALNLSPYSVTLATSSAYTFAAKGGKAPYTYTIASGTGTIDSSTGLYTAPATAETGIIQVTDSNGTIYKSLVTVMTVAGLSINPLAITVDTGDAITFSAVGGTAPYSYSIISGVGGTITSAGVYTAPGTTGSDTIQVTDSIGGTNTTIVQIGHPGLPVISPSAITLITNATQTFTASGGFAPYTYSVATGTGTINATTGLYTAPATAESSTVKVTDFLGYTATATLTVNAPLPLTISPTSASVALSGAASFTASGGVPPYTYTATSGTINATTGAYTAPATAPAPPAVTITVTDSNMPASTATATVNLTSGCGQTFAETEPNDAYNPNPFTDANQHGIILAPGCTATVTGTTDAGITNDTFQFHRGVSAGVTVTATWAGVNDIDLEIFSGAGIWWTSGLSTASGFDSLTYTFTATDIADVPVDTYFITVRNLTSSGVAYTVTVTGN